MNIPAPKANKGILRTVADTNLSSFFNIIAGELDHVKKRISEQLVSSSESVNALLEHINGRGGKMLRPALVLLAGKSCGHTTQKHIDIAAIVELIHAATLLHDDVIDEASHRRNTATVNTLWGNESAVLLGDFLLSKVFAMSASLQSPVITQVLSDTAVRMCHGELMQNTQRNNWQLTQAEYLDIVKDKTASLFSTCCYLGAMAAGGGQDQLCALSEYGLNLGTAFQITDDLLDITGDEGREGKTLGTDFAQCKPTLPIIHLLTTAGSGDKSDLIEKLSGGDNPKQLAKMLENAGSTEFARNMAEHLCKKATESLGVLGAGSAKDSLAEIADFVSRRSG
jgi:octaprenyl-diphosphate synthase